jgi:DNA-binding NarL/FixJ family response regulator
MLSLPLASRRTAEGATVARDSCACGQRSVDTAAIRVLLVDDHPLVRQALTELLAGEDDVTVVGQCTDGSQVVDAAARLDPDVVLMDLSMPGMSGVAATEALRTVQPQARVIVLTGESTAAAPRVAAAGAHALLSKGARTGALLSCLRSVAHGCIGCPYCL